MLIYLLTVGIYSFTISFLEVSTQSTFVEPVDRIRNKQTESGTGRSLINSTFKSYYESFVNSYQLFKFTSYNGIKLTLKWLFSILFAGYFGDFAMRWIWNWNYYMYFFLFFLLKVEVSLLYKLLSYYSIKLIIKWRFPIFICWFPWIYHALNLKVKSLRFFFFIYF